MNTFNLSLDLDKSYTGEPVRLRQGDKRGTVIRATIYDHGEPFTGSYTARYVQAIAGTGNEYYRADATFAAGVATVTVNEEYAAAVAGNAYGYFQFVSGSTVIASTQSFHVIVLPDATAEAEVGERYDSAIEDALAELDEATGRISQMVQDATAEYLEAHPEITTTVQDNSLDDDKLIQKGGILQREQWLESLVPVLKGITKETAEADVHSVTDSAGGGPLGIEVYGRSTQDGTPTPDAPVAIQSVGPNIAVTPYQRFNFTTTRGVTYSQNADGSITASGTATSWAYLDLCNQSDNPFGLERGKVYTFVTSSRVAFVMTVTGGNSNNTYATVTIPESGNWTVGVGVPSGDTIDETFRFSVFEGAALSQSAVPYGCIGMVAHRRNLLPDILGRAYRDASTVYGVTLTPNGDGTFTLNGTGEGAHDSFSVTCSFFLPAGQYTLSGCPAGGGDTTYTLFIRIARASGGNSYIQDSGSGAAFTLSDGDRINRIYFHIKDGAVLNNAILAPQIEAGSTKHAYEPYAPVTIPIDLGGRSLRSLPDGTRDEVSVDEWGHAVLTQRVGETTQAVTDGVSGTVGVDVMSSTGEIANGATVLYKLATPVTIDLGHLDPALLPAPDLTAYVVPSAPSVLRYGYTVAESMSSNLAPIETSPATSSHAVGTLLTLDGQLVKVTSAIAVGEAVTIGGNVRTTTIAAELAALA